jgi:hypothetical protein
MEAIPTNEYIEVHNGASYVAGTRIGLDVIVYDFRNGSSAEAIFDAYPYNRFAGKSLRNHHVHSGTSEGNRGLRRREQAIDFRGAARRDGTSDSDVLLLAAEAGRVLVSKDIGTMRGGSA